MPSSVLKKQVLTAPKQYTFSFFAVLCLCLSVGCDDLDSDNATATTTTEASTTTTAAADTPAFIDINSHIFREDQNLQEIVDCMQTNGIKKICLFGFSQESIVSGPALDDKIEWAYTEYPDRLLIGFDFEDIGFPCESGESIIEQYRLHLDQFTPGIREKVACKNAAMLLGM